MNADSFKTKVGKISRIDGPDSGVGSMGTACYIIFLCGIGVYRRLSAANFAFDLSLQPCQ